MTVVVVDLISFAIVVPILPFYVDEFGAGGIELGLLVASFALMQFIAAPLWGRLSDRIGRRPVLLITIAGNTGALLLLGLADSLGMVMLARILSGGFAGNLGVATAYIADATSEQDRARWMGLIGLAFAIGFTLGPLIGGVASLWGYSAPMFVAAALSGLNLLQAIARLRESPRSISQATSSLSPRQVLELPGVSRLVGSNFVFGFAVTQLETVFALYMLHRFGYDALQVAMILLGMAIVMGAIQGGGMRRLSARFGEQRLIGGGTALLAIGFVTTPLMQSVGWLLVPLTALAVGRAVVQPSLMTLVSFQSSAESRGSVMSTFQSGASLARVVGPLIAGFTYDKIATAPFVIAGVACLGVMALSRGMAPRGSGQAGEAQSL
ncbi:MAG: MFS transporter [Myxococcota bacterium]|nr:MFS transporter [Myxococcota bacterium]